MVKRGFKTRALCGLFPLLGAIAPHAISQVTTDPAPGFGAPLNCASVETLAGSLLKGEYRGSDRDGQWAVAQMRISGYPAPLPAQAQERQAALTASGLLRRGNIVAAKMANDEASKNIPAYGKSEFSINFENLLTILTQPVGHATYPERVRAEGENRPESESKTTHGVDLEAASASLREIISRAHASKLALGSDYSRPDVRDYLLAQGFRDAIALRHASVRVCALKLSPAVVSKINTSARFMAMPSKTQGEMQ
ncbi:hypothetical protein CBP36_19760 (plasmid) [Acidovorax carolinensis]|uniref:Uncharacterized protein n=1 Tax=Acidovorax carolinensis TaxID=553814 RepID=A0A240UI72_9BURK|nr:hypothetical protein [Acidovorax carolinensis]ART57144.1 hypothetical protein CBP35_19720 [Acidovorax carolinensis]ART61204.1 hypothetical protein CBP36_19760 [Acidovorax carolinensis]